MGKFITGGIKTGGTSTLTLDEEEKSGFLSGGLKTTVPRITPYKPTLGYESILGQQFKKDIETSKAKGVSFDVLPEKIERPVMDRLLALSASGARAGLPGMIARGFGKTPLAGRDVEEAITKYPGASAIGSMVGGAPTYLAASMTGQLPLTFGGLGLAHEALRQKEQEAKRSLILEKPLNIPQRAGRLGVATAGGAITGQIFKDADLYKTVLTRVLSAALGAGATTIAEEITKEAISGKEPDLPNILINAGINAGTIGITRALFELPQLRKIVWNEANKVAQTKLVGKPKIKTYEDAIKFLRQEGIEPEQLSPVFQQAKGTQSYKARISEAEKNINEIAKINGWDKDIVRQVLADRSKRQLLEGYYNWLFHKGKQQAIAQGVWQGEKLPSPISAKLTPPVPKEKSLVPITPKPTPSITPFRPIFTGKVSAPVTTPTPPQLQFKPTTLRAEKEAMGVEKWEEEQYKILRESIGKKPTPAEGKVELAQQPMAGGQPFTGKAMLKEGEALGGVKVVQTFKPTDIKDISGEKLEFGPKDTIFTYPIVNAKSGQFTGKILVKDGDEGIVSQGQFQNLQGQNKPIAITPEEPQVEEVVKGVPTTKQSIEQQKADLEEHLNLGYITKRDYYAELENINRKAKQETKFSQYQLPGGENYTERLSVQRNTQTNRFEITDNNIPLPDTFATRQEAFDYIEKLREMGSLQSQPALAITPEIRARYLGQPMAGGRVPAPRRELTKEEVFPDVMERLYRSEQEYIQKAIVEGKSDKQIAKELDEDITDTQKGIRFAIDHYREIEEELRQEIERAGGEEVVARKKELKDYLQGKLKPGLKLQGEYADLKFLPWLFAQEGGTTPDTLAEELTGMGYPVTTDEDVRQLIKDYFREDIIKGAGISGAKAEQQAQTKLKTGLAKKARISQPAKPERQETLVGRGTVLHGKPETNRAKQIAIIQDMPFTLLGNKSEIISRMSSGLKKLLTQDIKKVFDLFGGAKGYRVGLFKDLPATDYHINELSDERNSYYQNLQDPEKVTTMKAVIKDLRNGLIDRIAQAFEIPTDKISPDELRKAINKWLTRGMTKERQQFTLEIIQKYGDELLKQATSDNFKSPESSAIYYFLQNTSVFGISKDASGYHWSQGILRSSGEKAEVRDSMRRIGEVDKQLDLELKRDKGMTVTKEDAWALMDKITADVKAGKIDPKTTAVLVDPQYLNPTAKEGTYTVGGRDTTWQGHMQNLNNHLLPLIQTGVKIIYTNNEDINLTRWLKANKLPYNIEEAIGATALRGGRDEVISFINYQLPKEYTRRVSAGADEPEYLGTEISGESRTFQEWLTERKRLEAEGKIKPPSFGQAWTPEQRKALYVEALRKGLIYKDYTGKEHDMLHSLIRFYPGASFDQLREYISNLTGDSQNPPKLFKLFGDITKDTEVIKLLKGVSDKWIDINKLEMNTLDPVRIVEKVTQQDLWENILADNTFLVYAAADEAMYDRLVRELNDLDNNRQGVIKRSRESSEIMRKFEAGEPLTEKEKKVVDYLRRKYDALINEANEMRMRLKKRPIPYRKDYMTHILEQNLLSDFFRGDMDKMGNISQAQLDAIRKGDYTKGNMPFNRFALKRLGKKTKYDAIGNYEIYLKTILKEIYYTPAITHARKFIEYALSRQPNAYIALDRMANDLKGKTSIVDQNLLGTIASSKWVKWARGKLAKSALLANLNFWLINASNFTVSFDELGPYMAKGMHKFLGTKKWREFAFKHSNMLKGRTIDPDIDPSSFKTLEEAAGYITNLLEYNNVGSTFIGAYFKGIDQGYSQPKAIKYADAIARRTQVGYKKYELNAWMRSNTGMLLSQFQTWAFNAMNHLIYDLKLGNIPQNLLSKFTGKEKKPVRWGAFFTLLIISMLVNYLYKKAGLRQPYEPSSAIPKVPFVTTSRYEEPGVSRVVTSAKQIFTGKKPETKKKAAIRTGTAFIPGGTQISRFIQGRILPKAESEETPKFTGRTKFPTKFKSKFKSKF